MLTAARSNLSPNFFGRRQAEHIVSAHLKCFSKGTKLKEKTAKHKGQRKCGQGNGELLPARILFSHSGPLIFLGFNYIEYNTKMKLQKMTNKKRKTQSKRQNETTRQ